MHKPEDKGEIDAEWCHSIKHDPDLMDDTYAADIFYLTLDHVRDDKKSLH